MIPPAMRKASRLTPSAPRNALPNSAKANSSAAAIPTDRNAMDRRWAAGAPAVRLANMGAQPGGSITTRKVTRAEMNSSAMAAALDAFRQGEALPQMRGDQRVARSEAHTSELQSLMRISYAVFCLKKKKK